MTTSGGGWTVIFVPTSATLGSTTLDYTIDNAPLMTSSSQALMAYRTSGMSVVGDWASWALTANWVAQSPFKYLDADETVSVSITGAAPVTQTLRYGYANWPTYCTDPWEPATGNWGRICITNTLAPYYTGWPIGNGNWCQESEQSYDVTACSANRQFTIAVR